MATSTYATEKTREVTYFWSKSPPPNLTGYTWWKYKKKVRATSYVTVGIASEAAADTTIDTLTATANVRDIGAKLNDGGLWSVSWTVVQTHVSYVPGSGTNSQEDGEEFET